jgi:hypothetical protein
MSSLLRRNPTKIIPFILVSVLSAASACYAADPTLDGGYISSRASIHGVVLHLHGCDGLVRSGVIGEWLSRLQQMGFKVYAPNSFCGIRCHVNHHSPTRAPYTPFVSIKPFVSLRSCEPNIRKVNYIFGVTLKELALQT